MPEPTSCCSSMDAHDRSRTFVMETAPARRAGLTITGHLSRRRVRSPWRLPPEERLLPSLTLAPAAPDESRRAGGAPRRDGPMVHAERSRPLSLAARPRAVLGRRLGHARCLSGAGRDAARVGPRWRRCVTSCFVSWPTRIRTETGRSGSCSSSANAVSALVTRTATSSSGRWWRWLSISSPPAMRPFSRRRMPFFDHQGPGRG